MFSLKGYAGTNPDLKATKMAVHYLRSSQFITLR